MKNIQEKFLGLVAVVLAVIDILGGLFSYLRLAAVLFWDEYGETIKVGAVRFILLSIDTTGEVLLLGRKARISFNNWMSQKADLAFFTLVDS